MNEIDIKENRLSKINSELLNVLLKDRTTKKNLIWATDIYVTKGSAYYFDKQIKPELITGYYGNVIKPRVKKSLSDQKKRAKNNGEVFTPSWVCNIQNNLIDTEWFGKNNVFNVELCNEWQSTKERICFIDSNKSWEAYVNSNRLEIACGEAPYITSRYDTVSGNYIEVSNRIGFLDRKLRIVSENTVSESEWISHAKQALKATYGYDFQGDNVLIARENVLFTVVEHFEHKFNKALNSSDILECAEIISWNIWQMDGIKYVVPGSCETKKMVVMTLFGEEESSKECEGCKKNIHTLHNGTYCLIKDWEKNRSIKFVKILGGF